MLLGDLYNYEYLEIFLLGLPNYAVRHQESEHPSRQFNNSAI